MEQLCHNCTGKFVLMHICLTSYQENPSWNHTGHVHMFCCYLWVIKITWKISSLHSQSVAQNLLHLCYGRIFYLIFNTEQLLFALI